MKECCTCISYTFCPYQCRTVKTLSKNLEMTWGRGTVEWCNTMRGVIIRLWGKSLSNDVILWGKCKTLWSTETLRTISLVEETVQCLTFSFPLFLCVHSFYIFCFVYVVCSGKCTYSSVFFFWLGLIGFPHLIEGVLNCDELLIHCCRCKLFISMWMPMCLRGNY